MHNKILQAISAAVEISTTTRQSWMSQTGSPILGAHVAWMGLVMGKHQY